MKRLMGVSEARQICKDRNMWKFWKSLPTLLEVGRVPESAESRAGICEGRRIGTPGREKPCYGAHEHCYSLEILLSRGRAVLSIGAPARAAGAGGSSTAAGAFAAHFTPLVGGCYKKSTDCGHFPIYRSGRAAPVRVRAPWGSYVAAAQVVALARAEAWLCFSIPVPCGRSTGSVLRLGLSVYFSVLRIPALGANKTIRSKLINNFIITIWLASMRFSDASGAGSNTNSSIEAEQAAVDVDFNRLVTAKSPPTFYENGRPEPHSGRAAFLFICVSVPETKIGRIPLNISSSVRGFARANSNEFLHIVVGRRRRLHRAALMLLSTQSLKVD
ncbi:hypothetical protein EVAR_60226_1 [Eumeta japonica]|uniref:Uncharacterized protein n=1 Tax=Eumeta variegata TaxID=151549 RepID=A0A4C1ZAB0_EUMVA|nr:hypothetical protein EVAR_60226_1 [Eumeta japonica]